jgi:hypothetical protein
VFSRCGQSDAAGEPVIGLIRPEVCTGWHLPSAVGIVAPVWTSVVATAAPRVVATAAPRVVATAAPRVVATAAPRACNGRGVQRCREKESDRRRRYRSESSARGKKLAAVLVSAHLRSIALSGHIGLGSASVNHPTMVLRTSLRSRITMPSLTFEVNDARAEVNHLSL